jgi:nucleotide-binding universal stress UspA family protein
MINIKSILAPTDFSAYAEHALNYAGELAKSLNARMFILHVAEYSNVGGDPDAGELLIPTYLPEMEKKGKEQLEQITLRFRQVGVDAQSVFVAGRAYQDIVRMAKELKVDLIVMGTHGRTGFSHLFFGSTAEKVVRLCPCPVLTVKHPDHASEKGTKSNEAPA